MSVAETRSQDTRTMWVAPLLNADWETAKLIVAKHELTVVRVDEENRLIFVDITTEQLNALSVERSVCAGYQPTPPWTKPKP